MVFSLCSNFFPNFWGFFYPVKNYPTNIFSGKYPIRNLWHQDDSWDWLREDLEDEGKNKAWLVLDFDVVDGIFRCIHSLEVVWKRFWLIPYFLSSEVELSVYLPYPMQILHRVGVQNKLNYHQLIWSFPWLSFSCKTLRWLKRHKWKGSGQSC